MLYSEIADAYCARARRRMRRAVRAPRAWHACCYRMRAAMVRRSPSACVEHLAPNSVSMGYLFQYQPRRLPSIIKFTYIEMWTKTRFFGSDPMGHGTPSDRTPKNEFWSSLGRGGNSTLSAKSRNFKNIIILGTRTYRYLSTDLRL